MRLTWLHRGEGTRRLILIIAGWSTTPKFYESIGKKGWDVALVWNESDSQAADFAGIVKEITTDYPTVYLYGWSLGVAIAERLYEAGLRPTASFAINGTARPASNSEGIPVTIFHGTAKHLDELHLKKFRARISGGLRDYYKVEPLFADSADWMILQSQLFAEEKAPHTESLPWTLAFVGDSDAVFLPEAQVRHWERRGVEVRMMKAPHFIPIQDIIDLTVVDLERAGRRFARSVTTYDSHASAQRRIAVRLASLAAEEMAPLHELRNMLELGCGTGFLSRGLGERFTIDDATFIDLYPCGPFGIACKERFIVADAERAVEGLEGEYDLIASASAMQWFSDTSRFLESCSRLLAPGGLVAISSFARGNLAELDHLRISTIGYLSPEQLHDMALRHFSHVEVTEERIELAFDNAADALRHLKLTGVTASTSAPMPAAELRRRLAGFPLAPDGSARLTFLPLYLIARK